MVRVMDSLERDRNLALELKEQFRNEPEEW